MPSTHKTKTEMPSTHKAEPQITVQAETQEPVTKEPLEAKTLHTIIEITIAMELHITGRVLLIKVFKKVPVRVPMQRSRRKTKSAP